MVSPQAPADCHLCGRLCPLGGVPDEVGRPVHYLCRAIRRFELTEKARVIPKRVAKNARDGSQPRTPLARLMPL